MHFNNQIPILLVWSDPDQVLKVVDPDLAKMSGSPTAPMPRFLFNVFLFSTYFILFNFHFIFSLFLSFIFSPFFSSSFGVGGNPIIWKNVPISGSASIKWVVKVSCVMLVLCFQHMQKTHFSGTVNGVS